jgi:hypothetical protein
MKRKSKELEALDRQIAHWESTNKEHTARVKRLAEEQKHELDWFDLKAYQNMIYGNGWNK